MSVGARVRILLVAGLLGAALPAHACEFYEAMEVDAGETLIVVVLRDGGAVPSTLVVQ
ncbi:hypothetical protein H1235_00365 [Pseudoxanthomonas sp. NC8]|nr:hypothetical protein H1235_00365 [Pseudoxanthomonas sp. NC8]